VVGQISGASLESKVPVPVISRSVSGSVFTLQSIDLFDPDPVGEKPGPYEENVDAGNVEKPVTCTGT
jgi:hypothetical protein